MEYCIQVVLYVCAIAFIHFIKEFVYNMGPISNHNIIDNVCSIQQTAL